MREGEDEGDDERLLMPLCQSDGIVLKRASIYETWVDGVLRWEGLLSDRGSERSLHSSGSK